MALTLYSTLPVRRGLQLLGDVSLLLWVVLWVWLGQRLHDATLTLAAPGRELDQAGRGLADRLREAGSSVGDLPLVGQGVRRPFDGAGGAADQLAGAGRSQVQAVSDFAWWLALVVTLLPILLAAASYLPRRVRFVRRASAGTALIDSSADLDLFALRAMSHRSLPAIAKITNDPADAWRRRDPVVIRRLAELELRAVGLRLPGAERNSPAG